MRKLFLIFVVITISVSSLCAQKITSLTSELYILEGVIDKYPITMFLRLNSDIDTEAFCYYYYNNVKKPITLYITRYIKQSKNNMVSYSLDENGDRTEEFNGTFDKTGVYKGVWSSANKKLNFNITKSTNFKTDGAVIISSKTEEYAKSTEEEIDMPISFTALVHSIILSNPKKLQSIDKINMNINQVKTADEKSIIAAATEKIKNEYKSWPKDYSYGFGSYIDNINYIDDKMLGFAATSMIYLGGAHREYTYSQKLFSLETGEEIKTDTASLFKNKKDKTLIALAKAKLARMIKSSYPLDEAKYILSNFDKEGISDNFILTQKEIKLLYQVYELSIYSVIEIEFTFKELAPFIKETSELKYLF